MRILTRKDPGFPVVFAPAHTVEDYPTQVRPHLLPMYRLLERLGGISLGAQQVGIPLAFFIWRDIQNGTRFFTVVVNPRIDFRSSAVVKVREADLCEPGRVVTIERPIGIKASYEDGAGNHIERKFFTGLHAQVFLHEIERQRGVSLFREVVTPEKLENPNPDDAPEPKLATVVPMSKRL